MMLCPVVLVVDDDPAIRTNVRRLLLSEGYDVWEASNSNELKSMVESSRIDIVILDLDMLDFDDQPSAIAGLDCLRYMQNEHKDTPVIVFTDYGPECAALHREAVLRGAFDYIKKSPQGRQSLKKSVRAAWNKLARSSDERNRDQTEEVPRDLATSTPDTYDHSGSGPRINGSPVHILHLSDVHLGTPSLARQYRAQLETDLRQELGVENLDYLVTSGDIGHYSLPDEYRASLRLYVGLMKHFGLDTKRMISVPGNHDLNWDLSEKAYDFVPRRKLAGEPAEGDFIAAGTAGILLRNEQRYRQRFSLFSKYFYDIVHGRPYPLDYANQAIVQTFSSDRILFLSLNSAWNIDHEFRERTGINMDALVRALDEFIEVEQVLLATRALALAIVDLLGVRR